MTEPSGAVEAVEEVNYKAADSAYSLAYPQGYSLLDRAIFRQGYVAALARPTPSDQENDDCPRCRGCGDLDASGAPCPVCYGSGIDPGEPEVTDQEKRISELEHLAQVAECAFDDRPRSRVGHPSHMDWEDGYREGTRAAAASIRALSPERSPK